MNPGTTLEAARTQAFILAGGQGERLRPLTASRPKPAVAFGGMFRIVDFTLSNCFHSGVRQVSLLTQYKHEELHRYVRSGWSDLWNRPQGGRASLMLLPPAGGKRYRGTADAVFQNRELLQSDDSEYVLILSGDHIYHMDYRDLVRQHVEKDADVTLATVEHPLAEASQFGVVEVNRDLRVTGFEEKPLNPLSIPSRPSWALVSMGVYVFKKPVLLEALRESCEEGRGVDFGHDVIPSLIRSGRAYAYDFRDEVRDTPRYWRDIGSIDAYYRASMDLIGDDAQFDPYANDVCPSQPTRHPAVSGYAPAFLEEGAVAEQCVLMPGVRVGKGAELRRAIIEEGVHLPEGFRVGFDLQEDRRHHTVTETGVVVVSRTPVKVDPRILRFVFQGKAKERRNTAPISA
jgi:glucose-1-phosphate adenylyltransferase